ncbi:hypothetical protein JK358_36730 [Nocardia sp. 2]|uniref:DUF732 domain-containing protein n=1 Tax=Nocardia acididurans TaxID=2802282 RepID=A0ABS1MHB8_9NOCA|nr:hypothetical protein [Nocardia acididurans]MBL1079957.1 hypothetical protein [Nocardia acididurans]
MDPTESPAAQSDRARTRGVSWKTVAGALVLVATLVVLALEMSPGRDHSQAGAPSRTVATPTSAIANSPLAAANPPLPETDSPVSGNDVPVSETVAPPPPGGAISAAPSPEPTVEPVERIETGSPATTPPVSSAPVPDGSSASALEQCHHYAALVQQVGADGAISVLRDSPAWDMTSAQDQAIAIEAVRLAEAGACG